MRWWNELKNKWDQIRGDIYNTQVYGNQHYQVRNRYEWRSYDFVKEKCKNLLTKATRLKRWKRRDSIQSVFMIRVRLGFVKSEKEHLKSDKGSIYRTRHKVTGEGAMGGAMRGAFVPMRLNRRTQTTWGALRGAMAHRALQRASISIQRSTLFLAQHIQKWAQSNG